MKTKIKFKNSLLLAVLCGTLLLQPGFSSTLSASEDINTLKDQMVQLTDTMKALEEKISTLEKQGTRGKKDLKELDERLNKAELHTATDKISFGIDFRSRADSIHYSDVLTAPDALMMAFFTPFAADGSGGFNGATAQQIQGAMMYMKSMGMVPAPEKNDVDNDIIFTNRFRLEMKAKVNPHLEFAGRMAAYKVAGDSSGVKFNQGSLGDISFDGTTSSLPNGDAIHLERAYFNWKGQAGSVPINFSFGRRPSTNGSPMEYGDYGLVGGSPLTPIINWQFDGASLTFGLEELTTVPGLAMKLCYGEGFESDWGNSASLSTNSQLDDVHLYGFIATLYDNDNTSAEINYAHASKITDGFTGQTVMPFIVTVNADGTYTFTQNTGAFISRMEPSANIGDWDAATLVVKTNLYERFEVDIDLFLSTSWTHTSPNAVSENPFYNLMGMSLLSSNGVLEDHDGYGVYGGVVFPMPKDGRLGLEYNWGSKYWFSFTGAEDSLVGSKIAARGQVFEGYWIQPVFGKDFFVKLGGKYYDYEYTGSGNPLGEPVKISEATALDTLFPVVDKVMDLYLSATLRF
jgi:hypothetical protein